MLNKTKKTFQKRAGTTNEGIDYENFNIANIAFNLVSNEKIKDFHISSNDVNFGAFDDIVIDIETDEDKQTYALQLKHSDRGILPIERLKQGTGEFSIKKYFDSVQTIDGVGQNFILYTNLKFKITNNTIFQLVGEDFQIKITEFFPNFLFDVSEKANFCYKFEIVEDSFCYDYSPEILLYKSFFDKFFLFVDQDNADKVKMNLTEKFAKEFQVNDNESDKYVKVISEWSKEKGVKEKLNKTWVRQLIALQVLSSRIKPLSFGSTDQKIKILREAFFCFNVTLLENKSYDTVKSMWGDIKNDIRDVKELNKLRKKYHLDAITITCIDNVNPILLSKILWLKGKCPLIVDEDESVLKVIELCLSEKFILLSKSSGQERWSENISVFKNLLDLKPQTKHFQRLLTNFTFSLQGKAELCLETIEENEECLKTITTDDLLEMLHRPCCVGGEKENLPDPYVQRCLFPTVIDVKYLEETRESTLVVLDCVGKLDNLEHRIKYKDFVGVDNYLKEQYLGEADTSLGRPSSFNNRTSSLDNRKFGFPILVNENTTSYSEFQRIRSKNKDVKKMHQFRVTNSGNLEWVRSTGDVAELEKHVLSDGCLLEEKKVSFSQPDNVINIITSNPGMGKSELLKSLKNNSAPEFWTLIINPGDVYTFYKQEDRKKTWNSFEAFILDDEYRKLKELDKEFLRLCIRKNKIIYVWDALDEISDEHLDDVISMVLELSKKGSTQWVTSRCHLKKLLETRFNVLSMDLSQFNAEEQAFYIKKRLKDVSSEEETEQVIEKIQSAFMFVEHIDILGIPLQIFMLTELFRRNRDKYFALLNDRFVLTDLYHYFVEEKLNIYCSTTVSLDFRAESLLEIMKQEILQCYEKIALKVILPNESLKRLNVNCDEELRKVEKDYFRVGLVAEVANEIPRFLHNSFAEFFVAVYFSKNQFSIRAAKDIFFESSFVNTRFFFDLLLAKDSKPHIAVLYKTFDLLSKCEIDELAFKDNGGRTALHLACSWGKMYPYLNVEKVKRGYLVDDDSNHDIMKETTEYLNIIEYLLDRSNISEMDILFEMTPLDYARKSDCVVAEMKVMCKRATEIERSEEYRMVNLLFYSARFGYFEAFSLLRRSDGQGNSSSTSMASSFCRSRKDVKYKDLVEATNKDGVNLLYRASENGNFDIVQFLVVSQVNINLTTKTGMTPLWIAARNGHYRIVKLLVTCGAKINLGDNDGFTPFYLACQNGHLRIARFLRACGAYINQSINFGATPLHIASLKGHLQIVEFLISSHAEINASRPDGETPLHFAIYVANEEVVELLVASNINVNLADKEGNTALHLASQLGYIKIVKILIDSGSEVNCICELGCTPLWDATFNGHELVVEYLVASGADINLANRRGKTPLYVACLKGHKLVAEFLVKSGAEVDLPNENGFTPLHAASLGHVEIVKMLILSGSDVNHRTVYEQTPLCEASSNGHLEVVELLVELGAKVNCLLSGDSPPSSNTEDIEHECECTPLHEACENGHLKVVKFLVASGAKINHVNNSNYAPIHTASKAGDIEIVKFLIKAGADVNHKEAHGTTPLNVACSQGFCELVKFLIKCGADINLRDFLDETPLFVSCENGHEEIVRYLVASGAELNTPDCIGCTPLFVANKKGHKKVVDFLVKCDAKSEDKSTSVPARRPECCSLFFSNIF